MTLPDGAYVTPQGWVVIGDEAYLPEEMDAAERRRARDRERSRRRYQNPEYREWVLNYQREYGRRKRHPMGYVEVTQIGSLHALACTGPTRITGCVCRWHDTKKIPVYEVKK